jgi:glycosyltransferase involved in cell wall biosynthesis
MVLDAIESIKQQHYSGLEIVVADDGSTDNTRTVVRARYPEAILVRLDGAGPGPARNAGVSAASGDFLMFLDSDDTWLENHVRELRKVLDRGFQVAYGTTRTVDEISSGEFLIPAEEEMIEGDCFEALLRWCFLVPSSIAVSRHAFSAVNGFDDVDSGEDWLFFLKLAARFHFGFAGPSPITIRKLHRGSLCFLNERKKLLAMINQVFNLLQKEPRATAAHRNHFARLHEWTASNMDQWSTVQDWYLALLREKII